MESRPALLCSARLGLALVCFLGCAIAYACRSSLSFVLVCMVNSTDASGLQRTSACGTVGAAAEPTSQHVGEFNWSKSVQGTLLSAFFWGYTSSQVLGGQLATVVGGRAVVGAAVFLNALATLCSVPAARSSVALLVALRALLGAAQGAMFPAMQQMWSVWAPPLERSLLTGISFAGAQVGNVLVMPLSGLLCKHGPLGGWPSVFFLLGALALLWLLLWLLAVADSPARHRSISGRERDYIHDSLGREGGDLQSQKRPVPWAEILRSKPVWACFVGHFAGDWGAYMMATSLPLFMNDVLGYDLTSALFLLLIGTVGCGQERLVILYLTLGIGLSGLQYAGVVVNYLDIAPQFVGPVFGLGNTLSCGAGILAPLVMGWLTPHGAREEWQMVFMVTAAVLSAGALFFALLAEGEVQPWARAAPSAKQRALAESLLADSALAEPDTAKPA